MAVVTGEFDPQTVRAFRGVLDFYVWRGIRCVRAWPRKPTLPRAPAVQATAQDFADTSRALSDLPSPFREQAIADTLGSGWTWKDLWTTSLYGHALYEPQPPFIQEPEMYSTRILFSQPPQVWTVNGTTYHITYQLQRFSWPLTPASFNRLSIDLVGQANEAGQTVSLQLALNSSPTVPISALGNDLVVTNTLQRHSSGAIPIATLPAPGDQMCLAFKGSNGTVDLGAVAYIDVTLWQE